MRKCSLLVLLLVTSAWAQPETQAIDGILLRSRASQHTWLPQPCPDGPFTSGHTSLEIRQGKVVQVSGDE